jgi:hypothetical protein
MSEAGDPVFGQGSLRYRWRDIDVSAACDPAEWWHSGVGVDPDGRVLVFDQGRRVVVGIRGDGGDVDRLASSTWTGHSLVVDPATPDHLWLADNGVRAKVVDGLVIREERPGNVVELDRLGGMVSRLDPLDHPAYRGGAFRPTSVAIEAPDSVGRNDRWVADGYGQNLVHRFDPGSDRRLTIDGSESGLRLDCPHGLLIDDRPAIPRLLIADRGNARICVYDLDGHWIGNLGEGRLTSPSSLALCGDLLIVAELRSRLTIFDPSDELVGTLGPGGERWRSAGWPNSQANGRTVRRDDLSRGQFNSPHGLAATPDGRLYVAEWLLGGRLVELTLTDGVAA